MNKQDKQLCQLGLVMAVAFVIVFYACINPFSAIYKEATDHDRTQARLIKRVAKINSYASILSQELAWDADLARAFMVELGADKTQYRIWSHSNDDSDAGQEDWQTNVGVAMLTTDDVFNATTDRIVNLPSLLDLDGDILTLADDVRKGNLSKESFAQSVAQWKRLDPRFDPDISLAILVKTLRRRGSFGTPLEVAKQYLKERTQSGDLELTYERIKGLLINHDPKRVSFDQRKARGELSLAMFDVGEYVESPFWFNVDTMFNQKQAVASEREFYANALRYMRANDIQKAFDKGELVSIASLPDIGLVVDSRVGELDPPHQKLYRTLNPKLWEPLKRFATDCHKKFGTIFIVREATHSVMYQNELGSASISGPTGKSVEIQVDSRPCWRWVHAKEVIQFLRDKCDDLGIGFYTEKPWRNHLHIFLTEGG